MSAQKKILISVLFVAAIMGFSLIIECGFNTSYMQAHRKVIIENDIDVTALFYTESKVGIAASQRLIQKK